MIKVYISLNISYLESELKEKKKENDIIKSKMVFNY